MRQILPLPVEREPDPIPEVLPFPPLVQMEHLLKVAGSVARDANAVWGEIWGQLKPGVGPGEVVLPEMAKGFVPPCGWPELLEKLWQLKHYLDSIERICGRDD